MAADDSCTELSVHSLSTIHRAFEGSYENSVAPSHTSDPHPMTNPRERSNFGHNSPKRSIRVPRNPGNASGLRRSNRED